MADASGGAGGGGVPSEIRLCANCKEVYFDGKNRVQVFFKPEDMQRSVDLHLHERIGSELRKISPFPHDNLEMHVTFRSVDKSSDEDGDDGRVVDGTSNTAAVGTSHIIESARRVMSSIKYNKDDESVDLQR